MYVEQTVARHFHIGHNMPGHLPETTPHCVAGTADWAMHVWHDEVHWAAQHLEDDRDFLEFDTAQALRTAQDLLESSGGISIEIDGYVHWVEVAEGDHESCELDGEE